MQRLLNVMARLRDPQHGCDWDIRQTFETIAPYTIEEAYEVADAIEQGDVSAIKEELGDLLLQVVFHSQIASDAGHFTFDDVAAGIGEKMVRRHPHVFGDTRFADEQQQKANWELQKEQERAQKSDQPVSALHGVATALPALTRAAKIQKRAARVGFDWLEVHPVIEKVQEEIVELTEQIEAESPDSTRLEEELGDLLFAVTNVARHIRVDAEQALKKATRKFERRFAFIESELQKSGTAIDGLSAQELDALWIRAKSAGANPESN